MTNGEHSWVFVSDERYKVILVERNYMLMAVATASVPSRRVGVSACRIWGLRRGEDCFMEIVGVSAPAGAILQAQYRDIRMNRCELAP